MHLRGSWRSCGSRLLLLPWRDGPCASARGGSRRIWGGKEAQGHTRGGHTAALCGCCLGMGGEGRLLLAWHAVRWWGACGQGCPGDGEWRGGQDYPGVSLEVSGLNSISPLSPMPLEGLREKYQTQEPALTSLRPAAATTERHIQPQGHSCSVPTAQSHLCSLSGPITARPEQACTFPFWAPHEARPGSNPRSWREPGLLVPHLQLQAPLQTPTNLSPDTTTPNISFPPQDTPRARRPLLFLPPKSPLLRARLFPRCVSYEVLLL